MSSTNTDFPSMLTNLVTLSTSDQDTSALIKLIVDSLQYDVAISTKHPPPEKPFLDPKAPLDYVIRRTLKCLCSTRPSCRKAFFKLFTQLSLKLQQPNNLASISNLTISKDILFGGPGSPGRQELLSMMTGALLSYKAIISTTTSTPLPSECVSTIIDNCNSVWEERDALRMECLDIFASLSYQTPPPQPPSSKPTDKINPLKKDPNNQKETLKALGDAIVLGSDDSLGLVKGFLYQVLKGDLLPPQRDQIYEVIFNSGKLGPPTLLEVILFIQVVPPLENELIKEYFLSPSNLPKILPILLQKDKLTYLACLLDHSPPIGKDLLSEFLDEESLQRIDDPALLLKAARSAPTPSMQVISFILKRSNPKQEEDQQVFQRWIDEHLKRIAHQSSFTMRKWIEELEKMDLSFFGRSGFGDAGCEDGPISEEWKRSQTLLQCLNGGDNATTPFEEGLHFLVLFSRAMLVVNPMITINCWDDLEEIVSTTTNNASIAVLVDILIEFQSRSSNVHLLRTVSDRIFQTLLEYLTPECIESISTVLTTPVDEEDSLMDLGADEGVSEEEEEEDDDEEEALSSPCSSSEDEEESQLLVALTNISKKKRRLSEEEEEEEEDVIDLSSADPKDLEDLDKQLSKIMKERKLMLQPKKASKGKDLIHLKMRILRWVSLLNGRVEFGLQKLQMFLEIFESLKIEKKKNAGGARAAVELEEFCNRTTKIFKEFVDGRTITGNEAFISIFTAKFISYPVRHYGKMLDAACCLEGVNVFKDIFMVCWRSFIDAANSSKHDFRSLAFFELLRDRRPEIVCRLLIDYDGNYNGVSKDLNDSNNGSNNTPMRPYLAKRLNQFIEPLLKKRVTEEMKPILREFYLQKAGSLSIGDLGHLNTLIIRSKFAFNGQEDEWRSIWLDLLERIKDDHPVNRIKSLQGLLKPASCGAGSKKKEKNIK